MQKDSAIDYYLERIQDFIGEKEYKKIVLQLPKALLSISFELVSAIKKKYGNREFFVLYDSLKQPCCIDTLGAEHVGYDCLIHFGKACFSSSHQPNHYYVFPQGDPERIEQIRGLLKEEGLNELIKEKNIGYLVVDQPYYELVKRQLKGKDINIEMLRLAHEAAKDDEYLIFGYYSVNITKDIKNVLLVTDLNQQSEDFNFLEKMSLSLKSLQGKLGQKIFSLGQEGEPIIEQKINNMKKLMQRYSIISQLQSHDTFGILVSNTGTSFVNQSVARCQQILKKHGKKCFLFMMNNLNEVKLGNFAEIEVYIVISCHNHSLFSIKDFHRLVVAPIDLEIAFEKRNFEEYGFDMRAESNKQLEIEEKPLEQSTIHSTQLQKIHPQQIVLQSKLQTLAFYRQRQYKGLQFSEKKEVKKMTKGKIGLAQQYTNLQ